LQAGRGGGRADVLLRGIGKVAVGEIDWKAHTRTAIRGVEQMKRHAGQIARRFAAAPQMQEARNWFDYVREFARDAAKNLPKQAARSATAPNQPRQAHASSGAAQKPDRSTLRVSGSQPRAGKAAVQASSATHQPRSGGAAVAKPKSSASQRVRGPSASGGRPAAASARPLSTKNTPIAADKLRVSASGGRAKPAPGTAATSTKSTPLTADKLRVSATGASAKPAQGTAAASTSGSAQPTPATGPSVSGPH
jgi:hypothetical protein